MSSLKRAKPPYGLKYIVPFIWKSTRSPYIHWTLYCNGCPIAYVMRPSFRGDRYRIELVCGEIDEKRFVNAASAKNYVEGLFGIKID